MSINNGKKITSISILLVCFFCVITFYFCNISKSQTLRNDMLNSYFFQREKTLATYEGYFYPLSGNLIEQDANLNIKHLADFNNGSLYSLRLSQLEVDDPYDAISLGHEHLGYFFVQRDQIYCMSFPYVSEVVDYEEYIISIDMSVIDSIRADNNLAMETWRLVCGETDSRIIEGEWHSYIDIEENKRIYRLFSDYSGGTRYYELMIWERGKGLVYYIQGSGAMLMHIEFGEALSNEYREKINIFTSR